jgi:hypothetical protein
MHFGLQNNVKRKDNLFLLSSSTDKRHDNRRITISDRSILNEYEITRRRRKKRRRD